MQHRQFRQQLAAPASARKKTLAPGSLIDTSGLIFKPIQAVPVSPSSFTQDAPYRDSVIVSIDTLPLPSMRRSHPTAVAWQGAASRGRSTFKQFRESVWYTLLAGAVITIYLIVPLMTTLIPVLPGSWSRLLIAIEILALIELIICRILVMTVQQ